jgi:excinuclease ABC subunit B
MAEELSTYLIEMNIKAAYIHSDVDTLDRLEILRQLRSGTYDVLVGINLLREGLDLPEVALVAIMDADKEGYLRSKTSLIQTMGRAARHIDGRVIMYADRITDSMKAAIDETDRRRHIQVQYNKKHHITPQSITKDIRASHWKKSDADIPDLSATDIPADERQRIIKELEKKMNLAARNLEFEKAVQLRDAIGKLRMPRNQ